MKKKRGTKTSARAAPPRRRRNADRTRRLILDKAGEVFSEHGFAGTSLSAIVDATGVNKRMIYHYFGDKQGLYRAVGLQQWTALKDWIDEALKERFEEFNGRDISTTELLEEMVGITCDFMAGNQVFVRLMMWDGLEGGGLSRALWKDVRGPLFVQLEFLLRQAQMEGLLSPDLDRAQFILTFLGAISFYFGFASTLEDMIHEDPLTEEALERRKTHLIQVLRMVML